MLGAVLHHGSYAGSERGREKPMSLAGALPIAARLSQRSQFRALTLRRGSDEEGYCGARESLISGREIYQKAYKIKTQILKEKYRTSNRQHRKHYVVLWV